MSKAIIQKQDIRKSLAELLKDGRAEKNLSFDELSQLSGISAQHLKYLEAGNYDAMPAAIYTEHFLKMRGILVLPKIRSFPLIGKKPIQMTP